MISSIDRIQANGRNAQLSTGPTTDTGKVISSKNALRHGLASQRVVLDGESYDDFSLFRDGLNETIKPKGALEELLFERVVGYAWRLRRIEQIESTAFALQMNTGGDDSAHWLFSSESRAGFDTLVRYEASLSKQLYKALGQLQELQRERKDPFSC
jgi:hypothetical protein